MPLDSKLAERYAVLFAGYGIGGSHLIPWTKRLIVERGSDLREDARHFLLANFDQMIIQPICGYIPTLGEPTGAAMAPHNTEESVRSAVEDVMTIVMDAVQKNEKPRFSANAVIRAIVARKEAIEERVAWWRED